MEEEVKLVTITELYKKFGLSTTVKALDLLAGASPHARIRIEGVPYKLVHEITIV